MSETSTPTSHSPVVRQTFFWIGIISTVLYRIIIVLEHVEGPWVKIVWYVGTVGFVVYFAHRFQVSEARAKVVTNFQLLEKIEMTNLGSDEKAALRYVLGTLRSSKERWNYITIFVTSALALLAGVYLDFLK